ncbi:TPA: 5'-nucleotidase C-terminal domain-containing protein [Klebsiella variicola]|nr:5'-nucleotidase C-terminal domain-containing protein [Klebsiella variicola]
MILFDRIARSWFTPAIFVCFLLSAQGYAKEPVRVTILHTNDHHGAYWEDKNGYGGLSNRLTLIETIRDEVSKKKGIVLLLDAGDVNTGTPESDLMSAEPDFKGMNRLGYDAMTLGNHEFDNPLDILKLQQSWSTFPFLSANIYNTEINERAFTPFKVFERNNLKIGVFGLTTVHTVVTGSKKILQGLDFRPHTSEALKVLGEMQRHKPDIIIGLTHLGYYPDGQYGSNASGDVTLARELPPGKVDAIFGGHSHTAVCMDGKGLAVNWKENNKCQPDRQNGTWIFQALESGKYLGRADFIWKDKILSLVDYQLIPVSTPVARSETVEAVRTYLGSYKKQSDAMLSVPVATLSEKQEGDRDNVRYRQTNLGQLIIAAQMDKTGADFGIISSGSIRSSIDSGTVSYRDILKVQPFGNAVTYVELTGQEVKEYLNVVLAKAPGSGAYAQFYNISFKWSEGQLADVMINDTALDLKKTYRMSLPSYNADGGDGYPVLNLHPAFVNTGYIDAEVLKFFLSRKYPVNG